MDDVIAELLVTEGFTSVEDIASVDGRGTGRRSRASTRSVASRAEAPRAEAFLEQRDSEMDSQAQELGVERCGRGRSGA